ncbi:MAG: ArsR family transcriptional regulator [Acidimicrobiales bacterium]
MSPSVRRQPVPSPPAFVGLIAHPVRWALLSELARSDRAVRELTALTGQPQNLVSYHLRRLRDGGLVGARRSSADGRDHYYSVDLDRCRKQLVATGSELHAGLVRTGRAGVDGGLDAPGRAMAKPRIRSRVLFLCTGNSARSQMAEAMLMQRSNGAIDAVSAGSRPKPLHPNAVTVMAERGIDISRQQPKHLDEFVSEQFDVVITLCDVVREICPTFPSAPEPVHWSMPNPADAGRSDRASYPAFEATAAELESRIDFLIAALIPTGSAGDTNEE